MKIITKLKPSLLRNMQIAFILFGITIGACFPVYAEFFVDWKPGMYGWFYISCLVAGALIGITNAFLVKQMLLKKLVRIAEVANSISNKDVSLRCEMQSDDVIGDIIQSFNSMAETLRDLVVKLHAEADTLQGAAGNLLSSAEVASDAAMQQQHGIDQVVASMNEMASTSHEVASNTADTAKEAEDADEQGNNAKLVIVEAMCAVDTLSDMVTRASDVISRLEADSNNIGQVLSVINGIAEQTNLLALNAAIEAARAGEQGRGFAVVADEVRTLATRTQQSTQEITGMIESLQSGTREAVTSMGQGKENATNGVQATEQAVEALAMISSAISSIKDMNIRIASAAEEQNAVVTDVTRNVQSINDAILQTTSSFEQMRFASSDVAERASTIRNLISEYKL